MDKDTQIANLEREVKELKSLVAVLLSRIDLLEKENAGLRAKLGMNSQNSHKPPGTDGLKKPPASGLPKEGGKKQGGQDGHEGNTLKMVALADAVVVHHAPGCSCCGRLFSASDVKDIIGRRQVFDIPAPKMFVTEHRLGRISCCGEAQDGRFPREVAGPVQYGLQTLSLTSMLNVDFRLPFAKISRLMQDLYGCAVNEATIIKGNETLYQNMAAVEAGVCAELVKSEVVHFDESGMRVEGRLHWFHTACTALFCYLFVHKKRGREALGSGLSLLPKFKNHAVHDCWAGYFSFEGCKHALCNAHLLRELQALIDDDSLWAVAMRDFMLDLYKITEKGTQKIENPLAIQGLSVKYQQICGQADREEPPPAQGKRGKPKNSKGRNLLNRLIAHQTGWLAFAFEKGVPFSNNVAEQAIRVIKIKAKVAMSFRTYHGAEVFARIQGVIKTLRNHKMDILPSLQRINGNQKIDFQMAT